MTQQKISVIIPIFNAELHLNGCLSSIISQTFVDWECICVDDESSDQSLDIVNRFSSKDPRFRVVRQTNSGPGIARNTGLAVAQGVYFAFVDADDLLHEDMLARLFHLAREYKADLSVCGVLQFQLDKEFHAAEKAEKNSKSQVALYFAPMLHKMINWRRFRVHPVGKLYKSAVHGNLRFPNLHGAEDAYFSIDVYARSKRAVFSDERLYGYRRVLTGLTHSVAKYRNYIYGDAKVALHCQEVFSKNGVADKITEKVAMPYVMRIFHYVNEMANDHRLSVEERRSLMHLATNGICDVRRCVGSLFRVIPPIHLPTYFAMRFRLLWLLALRKRIKQLAKTFKKYQNFTKTYTLE